MCVSPDLHLYDFFWSLEFWCSLEALALQLLRPQLLGALSKETGASSDPDEQGC